MKDIMDKMDIAFPHLGIYISNLPKSFSIFGFQIALYGVIIAFGVLAGIMICTYEARVTGQDPDMYIDLAIFAILFAVIGARIYYVAFSWDIYKDDLLQIFNIRNGGLAIYGGVIGGFLTMYIFSRIRKASFLKLADTAVLGLILGQAIGRWGNFTNREAFGQYADNFLAMRIPIEAVRGGDISQTITDHIITGTNYIQVHPTFLYESACSFLLLGLLLLFRRHKKFTGEIMVLYFGGYGLARFFIEGIRTDQLIIPGTGFAVSQVLAAVMVAFAIVVEVVVRIRKSRYSDDIKNQY